MTIKSGSNSPRMGELHCDKCGHKTSTHIGEIVPACSKCGNLAFDTGSPDKVAETPVQKVQRLLAALAKRKSFA